METHKHSSYSMNLFQRNTLSIGFLFFCLLLSSAHAADLPADDELVNVLVGNELFDIAMDNDDVWIATNKGVNRYTRKTENWQFLTIVDGLVSNYVQCIGIERVEGFLGQKPGDRVWFGTDAGVSVYHKPSGEWRSFTTHDGLVDNNIRAISARGKDVWVITRNGASLYNKKKKTWTSYATFPGIDNAELTCVYHDSYYAWIGTTQGVIRYNYRQERSLNMRAHARSEDHVIYGRWEFFTDGLSEWISPNGGPRSSQLAPSAAKSPFPDSYIKAIDGNAKYVYIGTRTGLVRHEIQLSRQVQGEQAAYATLTRVGRRIRSNTYLTRNRLQRQKQMASVLRIEQSKNILREVWSGLGWTFFQLTERMAEKQTEVSDDILDVSVLGGITWGATQRGLMRLDQEVGTFQLFTAENGFVTRRVNTVRAWKGEVWAGTQHGLGVRGLFGKRWTWFKMEKALPSNHVTAVGADQRWVWFGTRGAASRYNPEAQRWQTYTRDDGLAGEQVNGIDVVGNFVWFATDEGISRLNKHDGKIDRFDSSITGLPTDDITAILVDGRAIWAGSTDGLARYDNVDQTWQVVEGCPLPQPRVNALAADTASVWVATPEGLAQYNKNTNKWQTHTDEMKLESKAVHALAGNETHLFVADTSTISMWHQRTHQWRAYPTQNTSPIRSLAADEKGVWMGSRGQITYLETDTGQTRTFSDSDVQGLSHIQVAAITVAGKYVWFATDNGVYRYDRGADTWWSYAPYKSRGETDILIDSNIQAIAHNHNYVYFGTPLGISRFDKITGNWVNTTALDGLEDPNVADIVLDGNDIWIATRNGVGHYDFVADEWRRYTQLDGLPSDDVIALSQSEEAIWVGTTTGAGRFDKREKTWRRFTLRDGLPDPVVQTIATDGMYVWFGTPKGVALFNTELNTWDGYTTANGLISDDVRSVRVLYPYVFINSPNGTTVYDKELGSFTPFSSADGLSSDFIQSFDSAERYFWFGTPTGVTLYDLVTDLPVEHFDSQSGLPGDSIQAVAVDPPYVWVGTDSGLGRYDTQREIWTIFRAAAKLGKEAHASGLFSHNIKSLASAGDFLWIGTRMGLSKYDKITSTWQRMTLPQQHPVRSLAMDGRFLWMGTLKGLVLYDTASEQQVLFMPEHAPVRDIQQTPDKKSIWFLLPDKLVQMYRTRLEDVWVTIDGAARIEVIAGGKGQAGVARVKEAKSDLGIDRTTCMAIFEDEIWIGKERGIVVYEPKKHRVKKAGFPPTLQRAKITDLTTAGESIWIGTRNGAFHYQPLLETWQQFTQEDGLASNHVSVITVDADAVWFGTADSGISRYDKATAQWECFRFGEGPADHNIRTILSDTHHMWFGTFSGGVCRYDKTTGLWTTYRTADYRGMP